MFDDRVDAGKKLARALTKYKDKKVLVLAIPRGGVEVGYQVAKFLNADFSVLVSRKLPYPDNPEAGFGAIAENGSMVIFENAEMWVPREEIDDIIERQKEEIKERIEIIRKGQPLPEIANKTVILVDDGIAMGSTMRAAIILCKNRRAKKIVVAVPVSGGEVAQEIEKMVDELIVLEKPEFFRAVAQVYRNWHDCSYEEVVGIMEKWRDEKAATSKQRKVGPLP
jgi:putative phosphoribosyl transferase